MYTLSFFRKTVIYIGIVANLRYRRTLSLETKTADCDLKIQEKENVVHINIYSFTYLPKAQIQL